MGSVVAWNLAASRSLETTQSQEDGVGDRIGGDEDAIVYPRIVYDYDDALYDPQGDYGF